MDGWMDSIPDKQCSSDPLLGYTAAEGKRQHPGTVP